MIKSLSKAIQAEKEKYRIPRCVRDLVPIDCMWKDGIFLHGRKYSKTFAFTDINYQVASLEDKKNMFGLYAAILNNLDCSATSKITISKHTMNQCNFEDSVLMPMKGDSMDVYRREYNEMLRESALVDNGFIEEKYVTISVVKQNINDARSYFSRITPELEARFKDLGSVLTALNGTERLRIFHDFLRPEESDIYQFDMDSFIRMGNDFRDYISPSYVEKNSDYLILGDRFARVLFLKDLASFIRDDIVPEFMSVSGNMMFSIDTIAVPKEEAIREVERRLLGVEKNTADWQRKQNQNNNFSASVPYNYEYARKVLTEFLADLMENDERMMFGVMTFVITAESKEQLDSMTDSLRSIAQQRMCQMDVLKYQQIDGLQTVLPYGVRKIDAVRTLMTSSLAIFMPFKVREIQEKDGMYFGENAISHNLIILNKENLLNQSAVIMGVPGSGKSFLTKEQIMILAAMTGDDIMICDPEGEYGALVEAMGNIGTVIRIGDGGKDHINAMDMVDGYGEKDPLTDKSQFILSLVEQIDPRGMTPQRKSIIDRCVRTIYKEAGSNGTVPTLSTLRRKLLEQPEPQAKDVALTLELYTDGSLDIFGHESNVNLNKRVTVFDLHGLGTQLKPAGLLVVTDAMLNRVSQNWKQGKRTHLFIDEFHVLYQNAYSAAFFDSAWRQFRKRNAYPTAITQNVDYLLESTQARTMLSNSEFLIMLNQASSDREKLAELLKISNEQMGYITNAPAGCGLIRYGSAIVPFVNHFPQDTELYQLMTTKPGEGKFSQTREN